MRGAYYMNNNQGDYYWCVLVDKSISEDGEIYLYAQEYKILDNGSICFLDKKEFPKLHIANGKWSLIYAASCIDGHAICVEHWKGKQGE